MSGETQCPYQPTDSNVHAGIRRAWIDAYDRCLATSGLTEADIISTRDTFLLADRKPRFSVAELARSIGRTTWPDPVFVIQRSCFYRRTDIVEWLGAYVVQRADRKATARARRVVRDERRARTDARLAPTRAESGFKGVRKQVIGQGWAAVVSTTYVGTYPTAELAALAVDKARHQLGGWPPVNLPDRTADWGLVSVLGEAPGRAVGTGDSLVDLIVGEMSTKEIWEASRVLPDRSRPRSRESMNQILLKLSRAGRIRRVTIGRYAPPAGNAAAAG